jgi:hypothetical protein
VVPPLSSAIVCPPTHLRCAAVVCSRCRCHLRSATAARRTTTKKTTTTTTTKEEGIIKGTSRALDAQAYRVWVHASTTLDSVALMQWHSGQDGECGRRHLHQNKRPS